MDLSIDRDFPELASKFTGADARAAVGIASGDAVRRLNASGGNDGKSAAKAVTGYVERQGDGERADGRGNILLPAGLSSSHSRSESRVRALRSGHLRSRRHPAALHTRSQP